MTWTIDIKFLSRLRLYWSMSRQI